MSQVQFMQLAMVSAAGLLMPTTLIKVAREGKVLAAVAATVGVVENHGQALPQVVVEDQCQMALFGRHLLVRAQVQVGPVEGTPWELSTTRVAAVEGAVVMLLVVVAVAPAATHINRVEQVD